MHVAASGLVHCQATIWHVFMKNQQKQKQNACFQITGLHSYHFHLFFKELVSRINKYIYMPSFLLRTIPVKSVCRRRKALSFSYTLCKIYPCRLGSFFFFLFFFFSDITNRAKILRAVTTHWKLQKKKKKKKNYIVKP